LPKLLEAVVVDIDDTYWGRLVDPRLQTQELVEDMQPELHECGRLARPQNQRHKHDRQRDQIVQVPADVSPEPPHRLSLAEDALSVSHAQISFSGARTP
jgi:hypothetical protein